MDLLKPEYAEVVQVSVRPGTRILKHNHMKDCGGCFVPHFDECELLINGEPIQTCPRGQKFSIRIAS